MKAAWLVIGLLILGNSSIAQGAEDDTVIFAITADGHTNASCGEWTHMHMGSDNTPRAWMLGYLSGLAANTYTPKDLLGGVSPATALAWIDTYCTAHPLDGLSAAGNAFMTELVKRRRR